MPEAACCSQALETPRLLASLSSAASLQEVAESCDAAAAAAAWPAESAVEALISMTRADMAVMAAPSCLLLGFSHGRSTNGWESQRCHMSASESASTILGGMISQVIRGSNSHSHPNKKSHKAYHVFHWSHACAAQSPESRCTLTPACCVYAPGISMKSHGVPRGENAWTPMELRLRLRMCPASAGHNVNV